MFWKKKPTAGTPTKWIRIADAVQDLAIPDGQIIKIEVEGTAVGLGIYGQSILAFAATCPHAGAPLDQMGYIDGKGNIFCSLHGLAFDPKTGLDKDDQCYRLKRWPVEVRDEGVFIGWHEA